MANINGAPIEQTPDTSLKTEAVLIVEKGGQYSELFQEGEAVAESLASLDQVKIKANLEKNPNLIEKLTPMLKQYWNVIKTIEEDIIEKYGKKIRIATEATVVGITTYGLQWKPGGDFLDMSTPIKQLENIMFLGLLAPTAIKLIYDLIPEDKKKVVTAKA